MLDVVRLTGPRSRRPSPAVLAVAALTLAAAAAAAQTDAGSLQIIDRLVGWGHRTGAGLAAALDYLAPAGAG